MIPLKLSEIALLTGGVLHGEDVVVTGPVEYDSRKMTEGGLFVAFVGSKVDGHDFVPASAAGVLGSRTTDKPTVVVEDPRAALGLLARAVLDRLPGLIVIGITGSSGKTSTKDMIGQLLARIGPTIAPPGSLNNELGLPYTVLQADAETRFLVLEMGARGIGHLTYLCGIAPPRIGVVVNVGVAHLGEFGSVEAIAAAKSELVQALPANGLAVLNGDDPLVAAMASMSEAPVELVHAGEVSLDEHARPLVHGVRLALHGAHQAGNALLAAAVARHCGLPEAELRAALADLRPISARRMDVFDRADGVTVIDDSYNANPASTAAALRALIATAGGRRTIAVLGYHAELGKPGGDAERSGHAEVGALAATLGVDVLIAVEEAAAPILEGAASVRSWEGEAVLVSDQGAATEAVRRRMRSGDVVLVKGSRYRTWDVVDDLRAAA